MAKPFGRGPTTPGIGDLNDHHGYFSPLITIHLADPHPPSRRRKFGDAFLVLPTPYKFGPSGGVESYHQ